MVWTTSLRNGQSFSKWRTVGEFLEWAEYYGQLYGTSRAFVEEHVAAGRDVILDIDVNGARQVKEKITGRHFGVHHAAIVFRARNRLRLRRQESDEAIHRRLEIAGAKSIPATVTTTSSSTTFWKIPFRFLRPSCARAARVPRRQQDRIEEIIASFGGTA